MKAKSMPESATAGLPVDLLLEGGYVDALQRAVGRAGIGHGAVVADGEVPRRDRKFVHTLCRCDPRGGDAGVDLDLTDVQVAHGAARQ